MKLNELVKLAKEISGKSNPDIKIVGEGGFLEIEVLSRKQYHDENEWTGTTYPKGNFICLEPIKD